MMALSADNGTEPFTTLRETQDQAEMSPGSRTPALKRGLLQPLLNLFSPSSRNVEVPAQKEAAAAAAAAAGPPSPVPFDPLPVDPYERNVEIARRIDAAAAQRAEEAAEIRLKDPNRKLNHNPNITKYEKSWVEARGAFQTHLKRKGSTVLKVMEDHFEEAHLLYLQPPAQDGIILKIQEENTAKYKEALGPRGKFFGVPDNLATKLTMLHFGLPIEPLTMNNVQNCSNDEDVDDEPDEPEDMPGIQRIMYAEKSLEFLDKYHERGFGFPMLRIAKPRSQTPPPNRPRTGAVQYGTVSHHRHNHHNTDGDGQTQRNHPIQPGSLKVGIRGGGGTPYGLGLESESESGLEPEETLLPIYWGHIHGYKGMFLIQNTVDSFLTAALQLLGIEFNEQDSWTFNTFIRTDELLYHVEVNERNYNEVFQTQIKHHLNQPPTPDWPVFVCFGVTCPNIMEPCRKTMKDIVRLTREGIGTSYWKLPRNIVPEYGINQSQPEFFQAMKLLFDPLLLSPRGSVHITLEQRGWDFNLGFSGIEATVDLWQAIQDEYKLVSRTKDQTVDLTVVIPREDIIEEGKFGSHLTGSHHEAQGSFHDQEYTYDEISDMSKTWLAQGLKDSGPTAFRVWHDAEERETNQGFQVIDFKPPKKAIESLHKFLNGWENRTRCIWWRPEWKTFSIEDLDDPKNRVVWDSTESQSLNSFKECLKYLWKDPDTINSFTLVDAQSKEDGRKFVVTKDTEDTEWRMHIYDWLHSNRLFVRKNAGLLRYFDTTSWGSPEMLTSGMSPASQSAHEGPPQSAQQPTPSIQRQKTLEQSIPGAPRINRERVVAAQAGKRKKQRYAEWASEQHFQDNLQRKSWNKDQSVIEPGRLPAAPLFGPSRELQIKVGDSMPTLYAQRMTPGDIKLLFDENQSLRNRVLDRMGTCPICDIEFDGFENERLQSHFRQHQDQLKEAGECPYCGESQWAFMTMDEKRAHMLLHTDDYETSKIKNFYKDQRCLACDREFSKMEPEDIIRHCLDHDPGLVRYCNRCGLDEKSCNSLELINHKQVCRNAPEMEDGDPDPVFCKRCGQDRTAETHTEQLIHRSYCRSNPSGKFCTKCGLDETNSIIWNQAAVENHNTHCMPPNGYKNKFCPRCQANLSTMDESRLSSHKQSCYSTEPPPQSEAEKIKALKHSQEETRAMNAEVNSKKAYVERRTEEQDARERHLARREREVLLKEDEHASLRSKLEVLIQQNHSHTVVTDDEDLGSCPFDSCFTNIGKMSRLLLLAHLKTHANSAAPFECPLEGPDGENWDHPLSLAHDGFNFTTHYVHKQSASNQAAIKKAGRGEFAALRALVSKAKGQHEDDNAFIAQRQDLLHPKPPAKSVTRPEAIDDDVDAGISKKLVRQVQKALSATITARRSKPRDGNIEQGSTSIADEEATPQQESVITKPVAVNAIATKKRKRANVDEEETTTSGRTSKKAASVNPVKKKMKQAAPKEPAKVERSGVTTRSVARISAPAARKVDLAEDSIEDVEGIEEAGVVEQRSG